jgi:transposase-like protein
LDISIRLKKRRTAMKKSSTKRKREEGEKAAKEDENRRRMREFLIKNGQILLPMVELVEQTRMAVDEVIDVAGRAAIEVVLELSAEEVAGAKSQGKEREREGGVRWHGRQKGSVLLSDRRLRVERPRLRDEEGEVKIPAYEAMKRGAGMRTRMLEQVLRGVSTREYEKMIHQMAETAGVSKSTVSREFVEASSEKVKELAERRWEGKAIIAIYVDGMVYAKHRVIAGVGVDEEGNKHVLGLAEGSTENTVVVRGLLTDLVAHGLDPEERRLFIVDGSKALCRAIKEVFGEQTLIQRCREHKIRNVIGYLPQEMRGQVEKVMRGAYKLPYKEGIARMKTQAQWLKSLYPNASASLLEGLEETFTINALGLTAQLTRSFATTNIIENPNGTVRRQTRRVSRWRSGEMVLRWAASAFLNAEKKFNRIIGYRDLWILKAALNAGAGDDNARKELAKQKQAA